MYDFLYQDTQPIISLLADACHLSLPQTRLVLTASLQAIMTALLAYEREHQASTVHKRLFTRSTVNELRQYNAMNFVTIAASLNQRNDIADAVFGDVAKVNKASTYIAEQIKASPVQIKTFLNSLCLIVLRELAILADYSQLDNEELGKWFDLQPQFLQAAAFDTYWYELTAFEPTKIQPDQDLQQATSNYLKAIGRAPQNIQQGRHDDRLVFEALSNINLPHQSWLLQLAKIADIYLSRNRLRITSEPIIAPVRPLVSLGLISAHNDRNSATISETPIEYDKPMPLWKNPVILIILLVLGGLGALAALKFQQQKTAITASSVAVVSEQLDDEHQQQDVAIVKVDDDSDAKDDSNAAN